MYEKVILINLQFILSILKYLFRYATILICGFRKLHKDCIPV